MVHTALVVILALLPVTTVQPPSSRMQDQRRVGPDSAVAIMILGSPHLRARPRDAVPVATRVVAMTVGRFSPDHIVVEWLHPSIDPATVFNYGERGDRATLARLWGIRLDSVAVQLDRTKAWLETATSQGLPTTTLRIRLGQLYYLLNDQLNAGYQWWHAGERGGDVEQLAHLTRRNFEGHELRELGFTIARTRSLEYLTPFDYQGPEAGSEIWGEMLEQLSTRGIEVVHDTRPGSSRFAALSAGFDSLRRAFEQDGDLRLGERYGHVPEVTEYMATWRGFVEEGARTPEEADGLTLLRWYQSPAYEASERRIQQELIPHISIGGLGRARWEAIHRRNVRMADFAEADIRRLGARRVLIIVGHGHKFDLEDIFRSRGYRVVPSSDFLPCPSTPC